MSLPDSQEVTGREEGLRPAPFRPAPTPVRLLRSQALLLAALSLAGAVLAAAAGALLPLRYRATASLLVAEPRLAGPGSVDFNLTPVRSYAALVGSRALAAPCRAALGHDAEPRLRIPENTRLVEISVTERSPADAAAFANCVAARAIAENARLNAEMAERSAAPVTSALAAALERLHAAEKRMTEGRDAARLESRRAALRAELDAVEAASAEEHRARLLADEAGARTRSLEGSGEPRERNAALAEEAGARARADGAVRARQAALARAAELERQVAGSEQRLEELRRVLAQAEAEANELTRRSTLAPLDGAAKSFELVLVSPAVPPLRPARPPLAVFAAGGGMAALAFGVLLALSRT